MQIVEKKVLVAHTPAQMFALVDNVEQYSQFLPWCGQTQIISREANQLVASLHINYFKVHQKFTTRNINQPNEAITIELVDGPFERLEGHWLFKPLGDMGCKIEFRLSYQFSNKVLEKIIGPVFAYISGSLVDAFIKQADKVYGDDTQF